MAGHADHRLAAVWKFAGPVWGDSQGAGVTGKKWLDLKSGKELTFQKTQEIPQEDLIGSVVRQTIPCFGRPSVQMCWEGSDSRGGGVILNVVLGLLLGLYPNVNRKPQFSLRSELFRKVHEICTSNEKTQVLFGMMFETPVYNNNKYTQTVFFRRHQHIVTLAFMEYTARVIPLFMPTELLFLQKNFAMTYYFEHTPLSCDEFR